MKNLILFLALILIGNVSVAQHYYFNSQQKRAQSFQVGINSGVYNNHLMHGIQIGANFNEKLEVSFFHMRDYKSSRESWMDSRWSGLNLNYMLNINEKVQLGPIIRISQFNSEFQKPFIGLESRFVLNDNAKIGFFYGNASSNGAGIKLIWNLY
ncbi:hypothetical protein [Roseivirga sp.]|uniref:hypothetical protein n=1 Tax=Roseivirga sp. TaxID=1964215 RepID=UPI003B8B4BE0